MGDEPFDVIAFLREVDGRGTELNSSMTHEILMQFEALTARVAELDALAWASLYHHQGGHGILGQAIRVALGIGQFDRMTTEQLNIAHKVLGMAPITTAPGGEGGGK